MLHKLPVISFKRQLNVNFLCFDDVIMKLLLQSTLKLTLLSFVVSSLSFSLSHWYPGSGVVLDCIDS